MIQRFDDFENTQSYGGFQPLPTGGYVVEIKDVTVKDRKSNDGKYLDLNVDIAEGDHKGHFARDFEAQAADKKWHGKYFQSIPGNNDSATAKRYFKTFIDALEASNPGYHFDWDESKFKGLLIGGLFNNREYDKDDGTIGRTVSMARVTTVDNIRSGNYRLPEDRHVHRYDKDGFMQVSEQDMKELPFD